MRLPTIEEWSAVGDADDGFGFITYRRVPAHWWLLDRWLERGHPHWRWWYRLWGRLMPYWGDPFCAAYTVVWAPFLWIPLRRGCEGRRRVGRAARVRSG